MTQVAAQILQLLLNASAQGFSTQAFLLGDGQVGFPSRLAVGSGFFGDLQMRAKPVDDLLAEFTSFVQQTQVGRIADRLFSNRGIEY